MLANLMGMHNIQVDRHRILMSILACPQCRGSFNVRDSIEVHGAVADADLYCARCGDVGVIRGYQPSFHPEDLGDAWVPKGSTAELVDLATLEPNGAWTNVDEGLLGDGQHASISGELGMHGTVIEFLRHGWSGLARVTGSATEQRLDLRSDEFGIERVLLEPASALGQKWTATIENRDEPERDQMIVRRVWNLEPVDRVPVPYFQPRNAGNPYPQRFADLLSEYPGDAVVVDVGGGDRRHTDPRVLNFEYMKFDLPDFFGNGLELPVRDASVDLVLSQAVLEHVPEPQRAVDEIRRILKPGGRIYCEIAFMQPLHAVPFHYFNVTPHGADLLFSEFDVVDSGTAGGLSGTLEWFLRLTNGETKIGKERVAELLNALAEVDASLTQAELEHIASFVYVEAFA